MYFLPSYYEHILNILLVLPRPFLPLFFIANFYVNDRSISVDQKYTVWILVQFYVAPPHQGLVNYVDTKAKFRQLKKLTCKETLRQVFSRVFKMEIQSVMLVFSTQLCELCNLLSRSSGGCWVLLETIFCRNLTLCLWPDSEPTKLLNHSKQKPRRGGRLRQINTCGKVYLHVNFFRWRHFALVSTLHS